MKILILISALALAGCATRVNGRIPSYVAGENFSTVSGGSCGTVQLTKGSVPWCSIPKDGSPGW